MAIKFESLETTQYSVELKLNDGKKLIVTLTRDGCVAWFLEISNELSVGDLIDVCNLIYSEKIIAENSILKFCLNEPVYVRGKENIVESILNAIKVKVRLADSE